LPLADSFVREVGTFRGDAIIPALNELRYAGHHVVQSISMDGIVTDASQIRKAHGHCERALYEASEAGIMVAGRAIASFRKSYPGIVISDVVKNYSDFRMLAKRAQAQVDAGRADRESVLGQTREWLWPSGRSSAVSPRRTSQPGLQKPGVRIRQRQHRFAHPSALNSAH
jgi:hypothetical protein